MRMPKGLKVGDIVECRFLDHCEGSTDPVEFCVWGRVSDNKKVSITIQTWGYSDGDPEVHDHNSVCYTIVKSAIRAIRVLR